MARHFSLTSPLHGEPHSRPWLWLWLAALAALLMAAGPARATEHIVERAWLEEPTGERAWEEVRQLPFETFNGVLTRGFGASTLWIRLRIDPTISQADAGDTLYLRMRPAFLDEIVLYDPLQQPAERPPVGDRFPLGHQPIPASMHLLALPAGVEARDIWLRVRSTSTRLFYAEVLNEVEVRSSNEQIQFFGALYLSLMLLIIVWAIVQFSLRPKDKLMLSFLGYQMATLLYSSLLLGYVRLYLANSLSPIWLDVLTSLMGPVIVLTVLLFSHKLLDYLAPWRWSNPVIGLLMLMAAGLLILQWLPIQGAVRLSLQTNMLMLLMVPWTLLLLGLLRPARPAHSPEVDAALPKPAIVTYLGLTALFASLIAAPGLGLVQGGTMNLYLPLVHGMVAGLLMLVMLQYRANFLYRRQAELTAEAHGKRQRAEQERRDRLEREQLLQMLGHELNTPLATLRMLLANEQVPSALQRKLGASVVEMAQVVERTLQTDQLENGKLILHWECCRIHDLLDSVCQELPGAERVERQILGPDSPDMVQTDRFLMGVVLRNLLDNALKYSPRGSPVLLALTLPNAKGEWGLTVSNRPGPSGWPDPQRLFQKYYRSPQASHRSGTGLGLYMVQGLVRLLGGTLHYEPDNEWVRFTLHMRPHGLETTT